MGGDSVAVVIPFRDRGIDPRRAANLKRVVGQWQAYNVAPMIVSDRREGSAQFNRSAAYNTAARHLDAQVLIFAESDMLISPSQITIATAMAVESPGLVVPFTEYRYLSAKDSVKVRGGDIPERFTPESIMKDGASIGAINVLSRQTLDAIGCWDESFEGAWYDDVAMKIAFEVCAGLTRWVDGPASHLWHKPGLGGSPLTAEDKAATARNKERLELYRQATTPERIRELTAGGH